MDPLSVSASLIEVSQLSGKIVFLLDVIKDRSVEESGLMVEISRTADLLTSLNNLIAERREGAQWLKTFDSGSSVKAPIDGLAKVFRSLAERLSYSDPSSMRLYKRKLTWLELRSTLSVMRRARILLELAMQEEHL